MKGAQDRRVHTRRTVEVFVIADLDTLVIALYVELTDRIIPQVGAAAADQAVHWR
jgi:hypothetical protein